MSKDQRGQEAAEPFYLIHIELVLTPGQFPVAGCELSNEVVTVGKMESSSMINEEVWGWIDLTYSNIS